MAIQNVPIKNVVVPSKRGGLVCNNPTKIEVFTNVCNLIYVCTDRHIVVQYNITL